MTILYGGFRNDSKRILYGLVRLGRRVGFHSTPRLAVGGIAWIITSEEGLSHQQGLPNGQSLCDLLGGKGFLKSRR